MLFFLYDKGLQQIFEESVDPNPPTECMDIFIVAFNEQTIFKTADTQWHVRLAFGNDNNNRWGGDRGHIKMLKHSLFSLNCCMQTHIADTDDTQFRNIFPLLQGVKKQQINTKHIL